MKCFFYYLNKISYICQLKNKWMQHLLHQRWGNEDIPDNIDCRARVFLTGIGSIPSAGWGSALSPLRRPVCVARAGVITAVFRVGEGWCVMEASHSVVTPLEHLRAGAQLHGAAACPAHLHCPQVEQVGAHGTAHGGFPQYLQRLSLRHSQNVFFSPECVKPCFQRWRHPTVSRSAGHHELEGQLKCFLSHL